MVDSASTTAESVNIRLQELSSRIDSEGERSIAATEIKISALNTQVEELQSMLSQLASESLKSREMLEEASLRLAKTRQNAEYVEREFTSNSEIKVTLVPFKEESSRSLANEIGSLLTHSGFKISHSPWSDKKTKTKGGVCISYMPTAEEKANNIEKIVSNVFEHNGITESVRMESKDKPISNSKSQVVIFFE